MRLNAMAGIATAADQRAITLCSVLGAAAIGIGAAVLAETTSDHPLTRLIVPGCIVVMGLLIGAFVAAYAGAPSDFYVSGHDPSELRTWSWNGSGWRSESDLLDAAGQRYANAIAFNKKKLTSGSKSVNIAIFIALTSPIFGLAAFILMPH
jgi:hypothetical protein